MKPRRRFAQRFLQPPWAARLASAIAVTPDQRLLEIGPGRGALTLALAPHAAHITAIEIDWDLAAELSARAPSNVEIIVGDILETDLEALWRRSRFTGGDAGATGARLAPFSASHEPLLRWRVVGNLPYNITSPILFRLLALHREHQALSDATLMMQREVADRLLARPGTGEYGVLGILVALDADVERLFSLPPSAFRPAPKVHSSVVRLTFRPPPIPLTNRSMFERLVRQIFTQRRKTLLNALKPFAVGGPLAAADAIAQAGLNPRARPETLQLTQLALLADIFSSAERGAML